MRRWSSDRVDFCGVYFWIITQECAGGWEFFTSIDEEGSTRLSTYVGRRYSLSDAADFHGCALRNYRRLESLVRSGSDGGALVKDLFVELFSLKAARGELKARIRIVKALPGPEDVPSHIREVWVGLELPLAVDYSPWPIEFLVDPQAATERLAAQNPEVAKWWRESPNHGKAVYLAFPADCCELLTEQPHG